MDFNQKLLVTICVALPITYYVRRSKHDIIRHASVAALWAAFLSIHIKDNDTKLYTLETMLFSVLVFIIPLKLSQEILFPLTEPTNHGSIQEFAWFCGSVFYYALPISRTKQLLNYKELLQKYMEYAIVIFFKLLLIPVCNALAHRLVDDIERNFWYLLVLFVSSNVIASAYMIDLECVAVGLLCAGRYEMLPMYNYPMASTSLRDFWGHRYNLLIHCLLTETVYVPVQQFYSSKEIAITATFAVSGVLHAWVAYFTFGRGVVRAFVFFLLQVPGILLERKFLSKVPVFVKLCWTMAYLLATTPLYLGLFVENYAEWLELNDPGIPKHLSRLSQRALIFLTGMDADAIAEVFASGVLRSYDV
jgi:hypothetical protein